MSTAYKDYSPGSGSYKVEEAGTIRGISSPGNICAQMGALTLSHAAFDLPARGVALSLSARFNSDHMYSTLINRIAKGEKPATTLMTLPEGQTNFYRICSGWSWELPKVVIGEKNIFQVMVNGRLFILDSVLTDDAYGSGDSETWAEGFHIKYGAEISGKKPLTVAIPEAKVIITCTVEKSGSSPYDFRVVHENDTAYPFTMHLADGSKVKFHPSFLIDGDGNKKADSRQANHLKDAGQTQWATNVQVGYWAYNATGHLRARVTAVAQSDLTLDGDAFPLGNGTEVYYIYPDDAGLVRSITAPDESNTLVFSYNDNGISGKVVAQGSPARKQVTLQAVDYSNVRVGDLITIRDESRVVWSKDGNDKVSVSGGFGFTPATSDFYHVSQGILQRVQHADGRCVKFYYYTHDAGDGFGALSRLTMLLSSNSSMSILETTDVFLSRLTFFASGLMKREALDDMPRGSQVTSFNTGEANALGYGSNKDEDRFRVLQSVRYDYSLTSDPDPKTDYITITNRAGAFTKYFFQKGGFCTHTYSDLATYTGRIKAKSTTAVLNIEKADFPLATEYYLNTSRIKQYEKAEEVVQKKDTSGKPVDYKAISRFSKVSSVRSSTRVALTTPLTEAPREGDVFLAVKSSGTLSTTTVAKSSSPTRAYRVYTDTSKAAEGDLIAIRNEVRRIIDEGSETIDGVAYAFFDVDKDFPFLPSFEGGKDECVYIPAAVDDDFYVFYLNKPKVVKIEERRSVDAAEWKSTSYAYEYLKGGNETIDDLNGGGFIFDDADGPADSQLRADSIELTKTVITQWREGPSKSEDYTQTVITFDYDENKLIKGEKEIRSFRRESDRWIPVAMVVNVNGSPCSNAAYYGVTSAYAYRDTSQYEGTDGVPSDSQWKERTDFDFDAWGRVIRSRKYSPAFPGGQALVNWTQYVGTGVVEEATLDPYAKFEANPYSAGYQALFDSKLCFEISAATVSKLNKEGLEALVCRGFDSKLNVTEVREYERTSLTGDDLKYKDVPFRSTVRTIADGDGSKTADSRALNHLRDADGTDWTTCVHVGDRVHNVTGGLKAMVTAVSAHDLTLDSDAFPLGNGTEKYWIYTDTTTTVESENYWRLYSVNTVVGTPNNNWDSSRFGLPANSYGERALLTLLSWDASTNVLTKVTKPEGNEVDLAYGTSWKSSFIIKDTIELDANLGGSSQYIVNGYDYDIKGRLNRKTARLKTDTIDDDNNQYDSTKYPRQTAEYTYDGMDRLTLKKMGGTSAGAVLRQAYDDQNRVALSTDFLGFVTRTAFDEFFLPTDLKSFKPNQATNIELSNIVSDPENLTTPSWVNSNSHDALVEDYCEAKRFTRVTSDAADGYVEQALTFTSDGTKSTQGTFRKGTEAVESRLILRQTSGTAADRINVKVDWATKTVTATVGTIVASQWIDSDTVWLAAYGPGVLAGQTNKIRCLVKTSGAYSHFTGIQAQDTSYPVMLTQTGGSRRSYDIMLGKVFEETAYTAPDEAASHRVIRRNTYDKLGRMTRVQIRNNDAAYDGDSQFKLVQEMEYLDEENAVLTRSYLDDDPAGAASTQSLISNDWLGRGVVKESIWPMNNGAGQELVVENTHDLAGNLTQRRLPSGEEYRFIYSSKGALEKSTWPDGTYSLVGTDRNGRVTRNVDRRLLERYSKYDKADMLVEVSAADSVYGNILRTTKWTHLGPASVVESESGVEKVASSWEYHWSGKPSKVVQTVDSRTLKVELGYDSGGNLVWMTPTGSGASPWTQKFNLKPQYHPVIPDTDAFNRTAIEKDGSTHVITRESDYMGLAKRIKYGDYASTKGEVGLGYNKLLQLAGMQSNEGTPALYLHLVRDFVGNVLSKEGNTYTYDGMNRHTSGEGETTSYDELSNLSARGTKRYSYQNAGESGESQMRLESLDDGFATHSYGYDNNGNVTAISNRFDSLVYDTLNRLREVGYNGTVQKDRYWYDGAGLRVKREERINIDVNTTKIYSLYGGDNPLVQERYVGNTRESTRFNIIEGGQILAQYEWVYGTGEAVRYFYLDQIGSRRVVKDGNGTVTGSFDYSAWGEATPTGALANYTGKEYDGSGLLYFNARYYDPTTGRFLTEDPSRQGSNWYVYCGNNPISRTDPTGMRTGETDYDTAYHPTVSPAAPAPTQSPENRPSAPSSPTPSRSSPAQPPGAARAPAAWTPVVLPGQEQLVPAPPGSDAFFIPKPSTPNEDNRFQVGLGLSGNVLNLGGAMGLTTSGPYATGQEVEGALLGFSGDLTLSMPGNTEIAVGAGFFSKYLSVGLVIDNPDVGFARLRGIVIHVGAGVGLPYAVSKDLP